MRPRFRASTVVYAARYAPTADALGAAQVDGAIGFGCVLRVNGAVESVSA